jgi:ribosome-associated protein
MRVEGEENGEWIIVDCGAAVVHIMQPAIREYYHLEEIWGGKPVKMKLGAAEPTRLVKAEEPPAPQRTAAKKAPAKKVPAKKLASASRPAKPREAPAQKAVRKIVVGRPARPAAKAAAPKRRA